MKILADCWEALIMETVINCFKKAGINSDVQQASQRRIQACCKIQDGTLCDNSYWLLVVNYYHKVLHLGCCSSPRSASEHVSEQFSRVICSTQREVVFNQETRKKQFIAVQLSQLFGLSLKSLRLHQNWLIFFVVSSIHMSLMI